MLKVEFSNSICHVTLNRPEVRNAFNADMILEMTKVFRDLKTKDDLRCVVLKGEGESFCAGADLKWMKSMAQFTREENKKDSEELYDMFFALSQISVPTVCFVHGHAMGGALGLIAASDLVLAESETQFCFSEVRLGLAPAVISSFVKKKMHPSDLTRYFLTAEVFKGKEALASGLIQSHGSLAEMQALLGQWTKKIGNNGPQAVRATKALLNSLKDSTDIKDMTTQLIADLRVSDEGQEGLSAFFEKRKPQWMRGQNG